MPAATSTPHFDERFHALERYSGGCPTGSEKDSAFTHTTTPHPACFRACSDTLIIPPNNPIQATRLPMVCLKVPSLVPGASTDLAVPSEVSE